MLQILRPVHCSGVPTNSRVRAGAMLHVIYDDYVLCQDPGDALPHQQYVCKVSYCGRQHFVRRRFSEFKLLHDKLQKELLTVADEKSTLQQTVRSFTDRLRQAADDLTSAQQESLI